MASNPSASAPTPAEIQTTFEQSVAMALHLWPALTLAVQNNWGGPDSSDKRDWFAGAIVDLFPDLSKITLPTPQQKQEPAPASADEPEQIDIETVLLQVMLDEFEVNVDDESALEVAETIMRVRGEFLRGKYDGAELEELRRKYEARKGTKIVGVLAKNEDEDRETDWDTEDSGEDEEGDSDEEMGEAPALVSATGKEKEEPEVDEDGFTKVSRRKR